jgi:hypothetical protein
MRKNWWWHTAERRLPTSNPGSRPDLFAKLLWPDRFVQTKKEQSTNHKSHDGQVLRRDKDVDECAQEASQKRRHHLSAQPFDPDGPTFVAVCESSKATRASGHSVVS